AQSALVISNLISSGSAICKKTLTETFKKYRVQFIPYQWGAAQLQLCPGYRVLALNLIDIEAAVPLSIRVFTAHSRESEFKSEQILIQRLYEDGKKLGSTMNSEFPNLWPQLEDDPSLPYESWIRNQILGCNNVSMGHSK
ncbi:MAG: hypothetical protein AB7F59_13255, partial [Bdellovibrionales bacterium]